MYPSTYETQAIVRLHRQDLLQEAARDRMLAARSQAPVRPLRRVLAGAGRWLVRIGTQLVRRYADAPVPGSLAVAQQGKP